MDYDKLADTLIKMEKADERLDGDAGASASKPTVEKKLDPVSQEAVRKTSRVVTTAFRKMVCKGIDNVATRVANWDMEGYTERVDADELLCDAFHTTTEKHLPSVMVKSPEVVVAFGLVGHAYVTKETNKRRKNGLSTETRFSATPEEGVNIVTETVNVPSTVPPPTAFVPVDDFDIDLSVHGEAVPSKNAINVDDFGFKNTQGEWTNPPASVLVPMTGRKRGRPSTKAPGPRRRSSAYLRRVPPNPMEMSGKLQNDAETEDEDENDDDDDLRLIE